MESLKEATVQIARNTRYPTGGDPYGYGATIVVRGRESRPHGEGWQVSEDTFKQ